MEQSIYSFFTPIKGFAEQYPNHCAKVLRKNQKKNETVMLLALVGDGIIALASVQVATELQLNRQQISIFNNTVRSNEVMGRFLKSKKYFTVQKGNTLNKTYADYFEAFLGYQNEYFGLDVALKTARMYCYLIYCTQKKLFNF